MKRALLRVILLAWVSGKANAEVPGPLEAEVPKSPPRPGESRSMAPSPAHSSGAPGSGGWWGEQARWFASQKPAPLPLISVRRDALQLEFALNPPKGSRVFPNPEILDRQILPPEMIGSILFKLSLPDDAKLSVRSHSSGKSSDATSGGTVLEAYYFTAEPSLRPSSNTLVSFVFAFLKLRAGWFPTSESKVGATTIHGNEQTKVEFLDSPFPLRDGEPSLGAEIRLSRDKRSKTVWLRVVPMPPLVYVLAGYPSAESAANKTLREFMLSATGSADRPSQKDR